MREAFSLELPLRTLFESPTVAELALAIAQAQAEQTSPDDLARLLEELEGESLLPTPVPPEVSSLTDVAARIASLSPEKRALLEKRLLLDRRQPRPRRPRSAAVVRPSPAPLSYAQQRLWFLDRLDPGRSLYNVPEALALRGRLDAGALERALQEVVRRHETLRTSFSRRQRRPQGDGPRRRP